jgi:hypothetical protein
VRRYGWRMWFLGGPAAGGDPDVMLYAPQTDPLVPWRQRTMTAVCLPRDGRDPCARPPGPGCLCGLCAARYFDDHFLATPRYPVPIVYGLVQGWGRTLPDLGTDPPAGWRFEHAQVRVLVLTPASLRGVDGARNRQREAVVALTDSLGDSLPGVTLVWCGSDRPADLVRMLAGRLPNVVRP